MFLLLPISNTHYEHGVQKLKAEKCLQNVSSPSPCESPGCVRHHHHHYRQMTAGDFRSQTLNRKTVSPTSPAKESASATLGRRVQRGADQKSSTCLPQVSRLY